MSEYSIGDRVESVGGIFKDGEVLEVKRVGQMEIVKVKWENGLIQERSTAIVRRK